MEKIILENIKSRRSIRKYMDKQISDESLNMLLEAAIYAPSGSNNQSWLFTVIQNKAVLQQLNIIVREAFLESEVNENDYPARKAAKKKAESESYNFYYNAPTLIIASNVNNYPNAVADCSVALQNIFLTANSIDLGTCWINQLSWLNDNIKVREFLFHIGLPIDHKICGASSVGYIDGEIPKAPIRKENTINIIK
jgi:nitroreductase